MKTQANDVWNIAVQGSQKYVAPSHYSFPPLFHNCVPLCNKNFWSS
jgi:hypothetical protein